MASNIPNGASVIRGGESAAAIGAQSTTNLSNAERGTGVGPNNVAPNGTAVLLSPTIGLGILEGATLANVEVGTEAV